MKKINYFGEEYEVSDLVNYVATDKNGSIWGHEVKPYALAGRFIYKGGYLELLEDTGKTAENWGNSLRKVEGIIVKENKLKVGDKVMVNKDACGFKKGQVVELYRLCSDGWHLFKGSNDKYSYCDGEDGTYLQHDYYKPIKLAADKKTFKIKCVDNKGNSHFTTGKEYDCFIIDESGYKMANCDLSHLNPCYLGCSLDNALGTFEMVEECKSHPHADLMLKYAMIAQYDDKPWESFECDMGDGKIWCDMITTGFQRDFNYRLKPQEPKIQIGQVWVSKEGVDVVINVQSNKDTIVFVVTVGGMTHRDSCSYSDFLQNFKLKE